MILELLQELYDNGQPLQLTPQQYQDLCAEVMNDPAFDDLILNYRFNGTAPVVIVDEEGGE